MLNKPRNREEEGAVAEIKRIDDCLTTRNGHLYVEECDTVDLVKEFGSPVFVLSEDHLRRNVRRFQDAFQAGWPEGHLKCSRQPELIGSLPRSVSWRMKVADVMSIPLES